MNLCISALLFIIITLNLRTILLHSEQHQTLDIAVEFQSENKDSTTAEQDKQQLSEYMGYLMWKSLQEKDVQYDLEDVIQGLKKAEKGEYFNLNEERYRMLLIENEKNQFEQKSQKNLSQANDFLRQIKDEKGVQEIEKGKLYFKQIIAGNETKIHKKDSGLFHIKCYTLNKETITDTYAQNKPTIQNLESAIQGFKRGVSGMAEGEKRILYIHPDLGYGIFRNFEPNVLLITEVKLIKRLSLDSNHHLDSQ